MLAGLRRRHGHFLRPPYAFASLVDDRTTPEHSAQILRDFTAKRACCHRPGLAQMLRQSPKCRSLDSPEARAFFHSWALSTTLSLSDTERQHSVNKRHNQASGGGMLWHQLAAKSINHNARSLLCKRGKQQEEHDEHFSALQALSPSSGGQLLAASSSGDAMLPQEECLRKPQSESKLKRQKAIVA